MWFEIRWTDLLESEVDKSPKEGVAVRHHIVPICLGIRDYGNLLISTALLYEGAPCGCVESQC
jgi:hypothetical protein